MDVKTATSISLRSMTRGGALDVLREVEHGLLRVPASLKALRSLVADWRDPVAIDDALRECIGALDPLVDPGAELALERLEAMRVSTRARATAHRRIRATWRWQRAS